ncbi:hypothetical protein BGX23_000494 [Mortierella sp. AD031]|nr:hypothetical protein BGX23_000494 [Mortierella sp. AD031]KAG0215754.1 hypothetical protein BGX33_000864 [Mortierella sp. NVP41]
MPTYPEYRSLVPPLSANLHKGQGGRVGILGGSSDYTGAPYFSGMASLRLGADLCNIICDEDAATAIKSYSPDLIIHPYIKIKAAAAAQDKKASDAIWTQTFDEINALLKRLHVLVVGPGLSRDKGMLQTAKHGIEVAKEQGMYIVIDADGLYLIQNEPELIHGYKKAVLTPNLVEFSRLCNVKKVDTEDEEAEEPAVQRLAQALGGVIVVQKGKSDVISDGQKVQVIDNEGGLKRSGGQGDILTGLIATSLAWGLAYEKDIWEHSHLVRQEDVALTACFGACVINRECSRLAFEKHKRALQSSDVLAEIGPFFHLFYEKPRPKATWTQAIYG